MQKFLKSKINRRIVMSFLKIIAVLFGLFVSVGLTGTFAYFSDTASVDNITVSTGCWVKPTTPQLLYPGNGYMAGSTSAWTLNPYMDWTDSTTTCPLSSEIKYQYESYHDAALTQLSYRSGLLSGSMIPAPGTPDGDYYWRVRAFDGYNWSDWSDVWLLRVDTKCPSVEITNPSDNATVSGTVEIRGTVTDANPHHYWLVIENSSGTKVTGPGTVNDTTSFTNKKFFDWITTALPDGKYTIKLEARDEFGNKCPNLAPVPNDPEVVGDSVDWIEVTVNNAPLEPEVKSGDVVINEVYYDVKDGGAKGTENKNEWIELYNNLNTSVNLKDWSLEDGQGNVRTINANVSIPAKGFAVLSHDASTWATYWNPLPGDAITVNLSGGSTAWLNNDGDKLSLKNKNGDIMDWVAWESFVCGWNLNAGDGQSIARKSKGVDTDSVSDWEVLSSPNPGTNPHSNSGVPLSSSVNSEINENKNNIESSPGEETANIDNPESEDSKENQIQDPPEEIIDNSQKDEEVLEENKEEPALPPEDENEEKNQDSQELTN